MSSVDEGVKKRIYLLLVLPPSSMFRDSERTTFIACMPGQQWSSMVSKEASLCFERLPPVEVGLPLFLI